MIAPLRLGRQSGNTTPTSKHPARGPSLLRNFQGGKERQPSAGESVPTGLKQTIPSQQDPLPIDFGAKPFDVFNVFTAQAKGLENVDPFETSRTPSKFSYGSNTAKDRDLISKRRKPVPPMTASLRSPSQASTMQTSVTVARVDLNPAVSQSSSLADWLRKTQEAGPSVLASTSRSLKSGLTNGLLTEKGMEHGAGKEPKTTTLGLDGSTCTPEIYHGGTHSSPPQESSSAVRDGRTSPATSLTPPHHDTLSVRNPDPNRNGHLSQSPSFQPGIDDASYFNIPTGVGIPAIPAPTEESAFPLAKAYSDLAAPPTLGGQGFVIPTSPDLSGQSKRTFVDKVYSKSPLSKSPGKGFMGKMVGAAKKAVHTGIKGRTGNVQKLMHNEGSAPDTKSRPRIRLDDGSAISQVPTMAQQQEARDLRNGWGDEIHFRQEAAMAMPIGQQVADSDYFRFAELERDLPVSPGAYFMNKGSDTLSQPIPRGRSVRKADELESSHNLVGETVLIETHESDNAAAKMLPLVGNDMANQAMNRLPKAELPLPPVPAMDENSVNGGDNPPSDVVPSPAYQPKTSHPPIMNERGLSVFKSRQVPHAPRQLIMPTLLSSDVEAAQDVPPVMPVCVPTPVSIIRPRPMPDATPPLNIAGRSSQQPRPSPVQVLDDIAERLNDPSPTKTERFRKVASWAQDAAIAPPPLDERQNDGREAALRRDEDRLAVNTVSFTPSTTKRALPSMRHRLPEMPPLKSSFMGNGPSPAAQMEADGQAQSMPGGPIPNTNEEPGLYLSHDHLDTPRSCATLLPPVADAEPNFETTAFDSAPALEGDLQEFRRLAEPEQPLAEHVLPRASTAFHPGIPSEEPAMVNAIQLEILSKTNALLEMIPSIQQKLEDQPSATPVMPQQHDNAGKSDGHTAMLLDSPNPAAGPEMPHGTDIDHREQVRFSRCKVSRC